MAEARLWIDTSDPDQISEFVMKQANGVKGLSEIGIQDLPKQYIQPVSERTGSIVVNNNSIIPIVDLSKPMSALEDSIWAASETFGFFQVINHGIPLEVLDMVKDSTYHFFALPAEDKKKYLKENSPSNHVRLTTSFVPEAESSLEWKDYLSLFFVSEEEARLLWPPICREQLLDYMKRCDALIGTLIRVLMKGLGLQQLSKEMETILAGTKRINLNYYPKCPEHELTVGVGRHSDVSTFTILLQDSVGGLYVRSPGEPESWIHVPPTQGALVINIGDALQIMSNGKYKSVEHRVVANGTQNRISVPLFVNPKPSDVIGPLDLVLRSGEKPQYRRVLYSDYVLHFYRKAHRGKDTLDYARI